MLSFRNGVKRASKRNGRELFDYPSCENSVEKVSENCLKRVFGGKKENMWLSANCWGGLIVANGYLFDKFQEIP
jgi:hypothetical protein